MEDYSAVLEFEGERVLENLRLLSANQKNSLNLASSLRGVGPLRAGGGVSAVKYYFVKDPLRVTIQATLFRGGG